jgi:glycosylphosphatidylinositol deacylase
MPPQGTQEGKKFTLLTDQHLDAPGENGTLEVLFCSVFPLQVGHSATLFSMNMDLSGDSTGSTRLACKNVASDTIRLPASTRTSQFPFDNEIPFSYLQYDLEDLAEHQFVAVVDKASEPSPAWVVAEFSAGSESLLSSRVGVANLLSSDIHFRLPANRPMLMDIKLPSLQSSLLTYKLTVGNHVCGDDPELFTPMVRQYISEVYESKFYVNVKTAEINLHGIAPYMPPPLMKSAKKEEGLSLQIWTDPTCEGALDVTLSLDIVGSLGKLWMRYRTLFAALPLLIVALALRKQFEFYDDNGTFHPLNDCYHSLTIEIGIFMSFAEALNQCLRSSIPFTLASLSVYAMYLANVSQRAMSKSQCPQRHHANSTASAIDYSRNDYLLGSSDPTFWFLIPVFGTISIGLCIAINYCTLVITHIFTWIYSHLRAMPPRNEDGRFVKIVLY